MCGSEIQVVVKPVQAGRCGVFLEWPWSLYRERVGFGFTGGTLPDSWPLAQHVLGSREAIVTPDGTGLPRGTLNAVELRAVIDAVCGVTRSFASEVLVRGRPRTLTLQTAWASYYCDVGMLAAAVGCTARTVRNTVAVVPACGSNFHDPELGACVAAVGDPRFSPLFVGDLRTTPAWLRTAYAAME